MWKLYTENINNSLLLLDQMEPHIYSNFIDSVQLLGTLMIEIPGAFTSALQPCDFGIMKLFKTGFVDLCEGWKVAEYARLGRTGKIPIPGHVQILKFLDIIWKQFSSKTVRNSFEKSGFTND